MKNVFRSKKIIPLAGLFVLVVFVSWQPGTATASKNKSKYSENKDTTAPKSVFSDQVDFQLNLDSVMQQVNIALSKIDYAKMNSDVQKAVADIDYKKMNAEINAAMKKIDWNKMKSDVSMALDSAKMAADKINWDEIKADMANAQADAKKQMALQKINTDSIKNQVQRSLKDVQKSLQEAKIELANYKALSTALQSDGLIKKGKPYSIELKEDMLYLNGIKQPQAVTDKYRKYYSGKKNYSIIDDSGTDL